MSIEGRIIVDALFHDKSGATSLKVLSLVNTQEYTTGKVAIITGTAGESYINLGSIGATTYKDASGSAVTFSSVERVAFSWSGDSERVLYETNDAAFTLRAANGRISITDSTAFIVALELSGGTGTGTYSIILWGTE